jgi:hypothetical protein
VSIAFLSSLAHVQAVFRCAMAGDVYVECLGGRCKRCAKTKSEKMTLWTAGNYLILKISLKSLY